MRTFWDCTFDTASPHTLFSTRWAHSLQQCVQRASFGDGLPKNTLDAPLFKRLTEIVTEHVRAASNTSDPTLEMFSHETPRADICNMFDPTTTPMNAPHDTVMGGGKVCFHNPIMRRETKESKHGPKCFVDLRDALAQNGFHKFSVTLIDPPFTPLEQRALYNGATTTKMSAPLVDNLFLGTRDGIDQLYAESVHWAAEHTTHAMIVFGYKNVSINGWSRTAIAICGAGSGHPSVWAVVYTHGEEKDAGLLAALRTGLQMLNVQHQICQLAQSCDPITDDVGTVILEHDGDMQQACEALKALQSETITANIIGKQDGLAAFRNRGAPFAPKLHPTYLSTMHILLDDVLKSKHTAETKKRRRKAIVSTRLFALYRNAFKKDPMRRRNGLFRNRRVTTKLCTSDGWKDASFVHLIQ